MQNKRFINTFCLEKNYTSEAKLLSIYKLKENLNANSNNYYVEIKNPNDSNFVFASYLIVNDPSLLADEVLNQLPTETTILQTPLREVVITSSSHCSFLSEIDKINNVIGATDLDFIKCSGIMEKKAKKDIINFGQSYQPNLELVTEYKPNAVFLDYYSSVNNNLLEKSDTNIIYTLDYLENTPLGRVEWIKFYGLLFDEYAKSDSIYNKRKESYLTISKKLENIENKPTVFFDKPYQGSWNIFGGESYMSNLIKDAGATYTWGYDNKRTNTPMTFEAVLEKASNADFWLIRHFGESLSYNNMAKEYKPFSYFKAFKNKNIWENDTKKTTYYEDIVVSPHLILEDLGRVFHADSLKSSKKQYFQKLNNNIAVSESSN